MSTSTTQYTTGSVTSADGTTIGYRQIGSGPGAILLGAAIWPRSTTCSWRVQRGVYLYGNESLDGEALGSLTRLFGRFLYALR